MIKRAVFGLLIILFAGALVLLATVEFNPPPAAPGTLPTPTPVFVATPVNPVAAGQSALRATPRSPRTGCWSRPG
jgi:hypothetical protein